MLESATAGVKKKRNFSGRYISFRLPKATGQSSRVARSVVNFRFKVVSGPHQGSEIRIRSGELVTLGRTERSDLQLEKDPRVSSRHCELDHRGDFLVVKDLDSTNGTQVDGQPIRQAELRPDQRLFVGSSEMILLADLPADAGVVPPPVQGVLVPQGLSPASHGERESPYPPRGDAPSTSGVGNPDRRGIPAVAPAGGRPLNPIQSVSEGYDSHSLGEEFGGGLSPIEDSHSSFVIGGSLGCDPPIPDSAGPSDPEPTPPPRAERQAAPPPPRSEEPSSLGSMWDVSAEFRRFIHEPCRSGLLRFRSAPNDQECGEFHPSGLLGRLAKRWVVQIVVHFQRLQREPPAFLRDAFPIFDWLPPETARLYGPVMVDYRDLCQWGGQAAVDELWGHDGCLAFLGDQPDRLRRHLEGLVHQEVPGLNPAGSKFYFCWPSVLAPILAEQAPEVARSVLADAIVGVVSERPHGETGWQILAGSSMEQALCDVGLRSLSSTQMSAE